MCPTPLWRGTMTWLLLDYLFWRFVFVWTSCSWLILVQVPSLYLRFEIFHPTPPHLHLIHDALSSHVYPSHILIFYMYFVYEGLPTRIDSCPPFQYFRYGGSFDFHTMPSCHSGTYLHQDLPFDRRPNFRVVILEKNPVTVRRLRHFGRRPRAKNPTHILVREKKSAPPASLWLSNPFDDTCSDCYVYGTCSIPEGVWHLPQKREKEVEEPWSANMPSMKTCETFCDTVDGRHPEPVNTI